MAVDVSMQVGLGRFFGAKLRAGVLYGLYEQSGERRALAEALQAYHRARGYWAELAHKAGQVYKPDITIGERPYLRGHWLDRLPAIDEDIAAMAQKLDQAPATAADQQDHPSGAVARALGRPKRATAACRHIPPAQFRVGQPLVIELAVAQASPAARLFYRHVNQAERYQTTEMQVEGGRYRATIPAAYLQGGYPLQYYFELRQGPEAAWLYPGFGADLANQPYFVVPQA